MNHKYVCITTSIINVMTWGLAAIFACKWYAHMANGSITFNNSYGYAVLVILGAFAVIGAIFSVFLTVLSCRDKISIRLQIPVLLTGMLTLWAICGN